MSGIGTGIRSFIEGQNARQDRDYQNERRDRVRMLEQRQDAEYEAGAVTRENQRASEQIKSEMERKNLEAAQLLRGENSPEAVQEFLKKKYENTVLMSKLYKMGDKQGVLDAINNSGFYGTRDAADIVEGRGTDGKEVIRIVGADGQTIMDKVHGKAYEFLKEAFINLEMPAEKGEIVKGADDQYRVTSRGSQKLGIGLPPEKSRGIRTVAGESDNFIVNEDGTTTPLNTGVRKAQPGAGRKPHYQVDEHGNLLAIGDDNVARPVVNAEGQPVKGKITGAGSRGANGLKAGEYRLEDDSVVTERDIREQYKLDYPMSKSATGRVMRAEDDPGYGEYKRKFLKGESTAGGGIPQPGTTEAAPAYEPAVSFGIPQQPGQARNPYRGPYREGFDPQQAVNDEAAALMQEAADVANADPSLRGQLQAVRFDPEIGRPVVVLKNGKELVLQ